MKISARNAFTGKVKTVEMGAVNAEVVIEIAPGVEIASILTKKSFEGLGLEQGKEATVFIKASSVMVAVD